MQYRIENYRLALFKCCCILMLLLTGHILYAQQVVRGTVADKKSGELLFGATVNIKGSSDGASTDADGQFEIRTLQTPPFTLVFSYVGYAKQEFQVSTSVQPVKIFLVPDQLSLKEVHITDNRLTEKQRESALTVESMDIIAVRSSPAVSFYDGLGNLKGVDLTSASLGFKIINTRGFNSTSPVRTLQLIDGVDNQAPGLNFSLGNFVGCSELDVLKTDLIAGASSAYYGPNAFNGVISITSRSPFIKPGLELSVKSGTRDLLESSLRYAFVIKDHDGADRLGMKFNASYLRAHDWVADNLSATPQSPDGKENPGGYDAVNVYGDEYNSALDYSAVPRLRPGIHRFYRSGYAEKDLVDYNTRNLKAGIALHYKIRKVNELIFASNMGNGTTVYQGDNRYSLKDILFFQNRVEYRHGNNFFIRAYATNENAGKSYDTFFTALLLQKAVKPDDDWADDYIQYFQANRLFNKFLATPGLPQASQYPTYESYLAAINPYIFQYYGDSMFYWHQQAAAYANTEGNLINGNHSYLQPGTAAFDSALTSITSRETFAQGGSRFYDKSALYHIQAEKLFKARAYTFTTGADIRFYRPDSRGTIFSDTSGKVIRNSEFGFYGGAERKIIKEKVKLNVTARLDKNENFDFVFSPAASLVYNQSPLNTFRFSFSSAIRNPTLADQYLYYRVGRAILIGNLDGYDSLVTIPSLINAMNYGKPDTLVYFNVDPVKPEHVKTVEAGYRTTLFDHLFFDMNVYYSVYTDFIGYKIGGDVTVALNSGIPVAINNIYRVATNSKDRVYTMGSSAGFNYYFYRYYMLSGNWSWNKLDRNGSTDPLIPAFNTPRNKFNIGFSGQDVQNFIGENWGFSINYKWVQGFLFEGSPQFTGEIKNYDLVDAQVSKKFPSSKSTLKIGITNLLNNLHYEVYGGPQIGRMVYAQVLVELN